MLPTWVISLTSATERRRRITERLRQAGIAFEFSDAIDGDTLRPAELAALYDARRAIALTNETLTLGQIATSLSHLALYRRMLREGVSEALILEDDAVPTSDMPAILAARDRLPADWDVILLYHGRARRWLWKRIRLTERHTLRRYVSFAEGAVGYLIRDRAARKLIEIGFPVHLPADYLLGGWRGPKVRLWGVEPCCVAHDTGPSMRLTASRSRLPAVEVPDPQDIPRDRRGMTWVRRGREILRAVDPRDPLREDR